MGNPIKMDDFGGTTIFGNTQMFLPSNTHVIEPITLGFFVDEHPKSTFSMTLGFSLWRFPILRLLKPWSLIRR